MDPSPANTASEAVPDLEKVQEAPKDDAPPARTIHGFKVLSGAGDAINNVSGFSSSSQSTLARFSLLSTTRSSPTSKLRSSRTLARMP